MSDNDDHGSFQVVHRARGRQRKAAVKGPDYSHVAAALKAASTLSTAVDSRSLHDLVEVCRTALRKSGFLEACKEWLIEILSGHDSRSSNPSEESHRTSSNQGAYGPRKPQHIICLGLGSLRSSHKSRNQLVLFGDVLVPLVTPTSRAIVYEPVFTEEDKEYLEGLGYEVLANHKPPNLELEEPTFLYMPHCPRFLYEKTVRSNWSQARMTNLLLLGNLLSSYDENEFRKDKREGMPCILAIGSLLEASPLPATVNEDGFNDTSLQWLPPQNGKQVQWEGLLEAPASVNGVSC